jgi:hypothetical protein
VSAYADLLQESGLVTVAGSAGELLMPARSLDGIRLQSLMTCLLRGSARPTRRGGPALALYEAMTAAAGGLLAERTVLDFIKEGYKL